MAPCGTRSLLGVSRYAFALKPKWILGHVIVVALLVGFVSAGMWQIHRLQERQRFNEHVSDNIAAPVAPIDEVLPPGSDFDDARNELDRRVVARGTYLVDDELVISAQASPDGVPGVWIVSPLALDDGRILLVNRGWLPSTGQITEPPVDAAPHPGPVRVTGWVSETQAPAEGESREPAVDHQVTFLRIDVERIQQQFAEPLVPAFLLRSGQSPADEGAGQPTNLELPALSTGPHLSYVIQWFGFALVALVGYPLLLWLIARERARPRPVAVDEADLPPGAFVDAEGIIDMTAVRHDSTTPRDDADEREPDRR